jgi:hypothetical protein
MVPISSTPPAMSNMGSVLQSAVAVNSVQLSTLLFRRILDSLIVVSW